MSQTQGHFRFYADDGGEQDSTPLAAEDAPITVQEGVPFHFRVQIDTSGDEPGTEYRLEWEPVP